VVESCESNCTRKMSGYLYTALLSRPTHECSNLEVAADWRELMVAQSILRVSIAACGAVNRLPIAPLSHTRPLRTPQQWLRKLCNFRSRWWWKLSWLRHAAAAGSIIIIATCWRLFTVNTVSVESPDFLLVSFNTLPLDHCTQATLWTLYDCIAP